MYHWFDMLVAVPLTVDTIIFVDFLIQRVNFTEAFK